MEFIAFSFDDKNKSVKDLGIVSYVKTQETKFFLLSNLGYWYFLDIKLNNNSPTDDLNIQKVDNDKGYIFSCAEQEYDIKKFNPRVIAKRLEQNSLLEKLATITKPNY